MTNVQLYLSIGLPLLFNAAIAGLLVAYMNARFEGLEKVMIAKFETAHSELIRVEQVLDARLKHAEERR